MHRTSRDSSMGPVSPPRVAAGFPGGTEAENRQQEAQALRSHFDQRASVRQQLRQKQTSCIISCGACPGCGDHAQASDQGGARLPEEGDPAEGECPRQPGLPPGTLSVPLSPHSTLAQKAHGGASWPCICPAAPAADAFPDFPYGASP